MALLGSTVNMLFLYILFFFYGYVFYAGCLNAWHPSLPLWIKAILIPPIAIFGLADIIINFFLGSLLYLDIPFRHGWTFTQRTCYWYHTVGDYRKSLADWFASILNPFNKDHIS